MRKLMLALVGACAAAVGFADSTSAEILAKLGSSTNPDKVEAIDLGNNLYAIRFAGAQTSTFTFSSKCTVKEALVVGGGGAGGGDCGAGGGGGGLIHLTDLSSEYGISDALSLTVGAGGTVSGEKKKGTPGTSSFLSLAGATYTAFGGGGGGQWTSGGNDKPVAGSDGTGCGAGAIGSGGVGTTTMDTSIPGYYANSGGGSSGITNAGGGGGGAGSEGSAVITDGKIGGNGGDGLQLSITGEPVYYAAGGGGGSGESTSTCGLGGQGGGGDGGLAVSGRIGLSATGYGCGGGGGGGGNKGSSKGGAGSDGVVILVVLRSSEKAEFGVIVSSDATAYDTWTAELMFVGLDENSAPAQAYLTLSKNSDGANPVIENQPFGAAQSEEYASFSATVSGLEPSTTYYAFITATNNATESVSADMITFTTLTPTAPSGSFKLITLGRDFQTFEATLADFGNGSTNAVLAMELSTTEGFDEIAASASVTIDATGAATLTVSGLESGVLYYSRLKIDNSWHVPYVTAAQSYTTRSPVECAGIGYTTTDTGFDVSVAISYVSVDDATVTLFADGVQVGETQPITAAGNYPFAVTTAAKSVALKAVVAYGATEKEFTVTATKGTSSQIVGNVADHATVATALKVKPGDQITLPPLVGLASYKILNHSFLSLDGTVLTAIKPGIVGVEAYGVDGALVATMGILVLPEKIGSGNIYIKKDKSESWGAASAWLNADGSQATDYPHLADDIAIIPDSETWKCYMPIPAGAVLGGLYVGRFVNAEGGVVLRYNKLTFQRTDGKPVMIQACSNSRISGKSSGAIQFADQATEFYYASDTIFDGGWDGIDATVATARPNYNANGTHEIPAGVTLSWRNLDNTKIQQGQNMIDCPILIGEGTVWNRSAAGIKYSRDCSRFTGAYRDSSRGNSGTWVSAPTWLRHASVTNGSVEVYGYVNNPSGSPSISGSGVGFLGTGGDHTSVGPAPHEDSWFPKKGLTMVNSQYDMAQIENSSWKGAPEKKLTDNFTVGPGFSAVIPLNDLRSTANGHPINWFETADLTHLNKGTLRFDDLDSKHQNNPASPMHSVTILHGYDKYAVGGGTDDPKTGPSYPIVPWLVGQSKKSNDSINFVCVDENERVCGVSFNNTGVEPKTVTDPNQNVYAWSKSLALNESKTFNSLMLCSNGNSTKMGADKTLTLTSGGLILYYGGSKHSSIGTQTGGADNGALILGDETHPGYVFACSTSATAPCGIWAPTTAPGGLVFGYTGYALLAGDQTGVDDELVVNAGTLDLGSQDKSVACTLDVPVRILANATVKMNNVSMRLSNIYLDDIAGYGGKIQLNAAETKCQKLYVRDTPEETEWTSLPAGTYGATGSGAEFIDDTRFSGTGVLTVRTDDISSGLMIFLR